MNDDRGNPQRMPPVAAIAEPGWRGRGLVPLAVAAVLGLMACQGRWPSPAATGEHDRLRGAGAAAGPERPGPQVALHIARCLPDGVTLDRVAQTPLHTVLGGTAGDLGGIADLLENLLRMPGIEAPTLRRATRAERGYAYTVIVPRSSPAAARAVRRDGGSARRPPPFAALPVARSLFRLLIPPGT